MIRNAYLIFFITLIATGSLAASATDEMRLAHRPLSSLNCPASRTTGDAEYAGRVIDAAMSVSKNAMTKAKIQTPPDKPTAQQRVHLVMAGVR